MSLDRLYLMDISYGRVRLESPLIVKETPNMYYLEKGVFRAFDFINQVRKDDRRAQCKTAQEAFEIARTQLNAAIGLQEKRLREAQEQLGRFEKYVAEYEEDTEDGKEDS